MVEATDGVTCFMLAPCVIRRIAMVTVMALLPGTGFNCIVASLAIYTDTLVIGCSNKQTLPQQKIV
jgi:hypothetical protein